MVVSVGMVNFQPTEEQQLIREMVASFAREQMRPLAHDADESEQVPRGQSLRPFRGSVVALPWVENSPCRQPSFIAETYFFCIAIVPLRGRVASGEQDAFLNS